MQGVRRFRDYLRTQLKDSIVRKAYEEESARLPAAIASSGRSAKQRRHLVRRISSKLNSSYTRS
jgi:hypothetical protein